MMRAALASAPPPGIAPVSIRGAVMALVAAVVLCWPMLIVSAPLVFNDSKTYMDQGQELLRLLLDMVRSGPDAAQQRAGELNGRMVRSAIYSIYVFLGSRWPLGPMVPAIAQAAAVLFLLGALVRRELQAPPAAIAVVAALVAALTSLPWFASFLMPDILAAAVILYAAMLVRSFETFDLGQRLALGAIAAFATISHYGHVPLAAACTGAALLLLLAQRRLTGAAITAGLAPIVFAIGANAAIGWFAYDGASAAPRRLPILLARSIEDGPARWYLQENCATEPYAICEAFPEIPDRVEEVLWAETGLRNASPELYQRIRAEELAILSRAFVRYPAQQAWSFAGNAARQFVRFGADDFQWGGFVRMERAADNTAWDPRGFLLVAWDRDRDRTLFDVFGAVQTGSVLFGLLALIWLARADGLRAGRFERETLAIVAVGLIANAAIFGGLSAPADRYQSRIAWIVPALAALFWLERRRRAAQAHRSLA